MDEDNIRNNNRDTVFPKQPSIPISSCEIDVNESFVSETKRIRDLYINKIKHMEIVFTGFTDVIKNSNLDLDQKTSAKQCLTKLKKSMKGIREADKKVQIWLNRLLDYKIQDEFWPQVSQQNSPGDSNSGDSNSGEIMDFPERRSRSKVLHPSNKISALYQFIVYQLLNSILLLHDEISSFSKYQADIIWVLGNQSLKKNQFPTEMIPPKLSRGDCLESIATVLELDGIPSIPLASILKQLSSWNVYLSSYGKKELSLYSFMIFTERERKKILMDG